ncbi:hypothetical protein SDC9_136617 [bioreactor metagenome]|uniref:Uncharacterized protein n=1 Tax=bioreactor metagenome TaxID=1076179 RepID=A0A645DKB5_9ZZZZ
MQVQFPRNKTDVAVKVAQFHWRALLQYRLELFDPLRVERCGFLSGSGGVVKSLKQFRNRLIVTVYDGMFVGNNEVPDVDDLFLQLLESGGKTEVCTRNASGRV